MTKSALTSGLKKTPPRIWGHQSRYRSYLYNQGIVQTTGIALRAAAILPYHLMLQ